MPKPVCVEILALSGAMASGMAITLDVLATANRLRMAAGRAPPFKIRITGSGAPLARAMAGKLYKTSHAADLIILPGLGMSTEGEVAQRLAQPDAIQAKRRLATAAGRGAMIAASCSSVFLVAATGLLDGRRATTTWWLAPLFRRLHPKVQLDTEALVVSDGPITTAGAAMAQMDLMLALVTRHAGARLATQCARYMLLDERRSQTPYMALGFLAAADEHVACAEAWARKRLDKAFTVVDLAAAAGLAPRTFARRVEQATGLSPVRFLRRLRVERAVELLETSAVAFEEIARQVGYAEPTTLRRALQQEAGRTARDLRAKRKPKPAR